MLGPVMVHEQNLEIQGTRIANKIQKFVKPEGGGGNGKSRCWFHILKGY